MTFRRVVCLLVLLGSTLPAANLLPQQEQRATGTPGIPKTTAAFHRPGYAGDEACTACHREQSLSYAHTAHRHTSAMPDRSAVLGSFQAGSNVLTISDPAKHPGEPALFFRMEERGGSYYQTAVTGWGDRLISRSEPIDIVTGSGVRGQTFLYWHGDSLFELPVSYWTDGRRWINSPGYIDGTVDFSRPVNPGCLECHATYIRPLSSDPRTNSYDRQTFVPGISCETCHGPGTAHAAKFAKQPTPASATSETAILNPAHFSRDRQVDACAYCHNGIQRQALAPAFSFEPGRPLSDYFKPLPVDAAEHPDVHGNQVGLLQRSRCYQSSPNMSCSTCHDTHAREKPASSYSSRCLRCHQWTSCGMAKKLGHRIADNCIDCHMPEEETNLIVSETAGELLRAKMRNHWIKVYAPSQSR